MAATSEPDGGDATHATTFAVIGDFGQVRKRYIAQVAQLVTHWQPTFIATVGDNRYEPSTYRETVGRHYCAFTGRHHSAHGDSMCRTRRRVNAFFPVIGNHDAANITEYNAYFTLPGAGVNSTRTSGSNRFYDVRHEHIHLFFVDCYASVNETERQKRWLQAQLAVSSAVWKLVLLHEPPFSSGAAHGSNARFRWPFAAWGAHIIMSGNDHHYERVERDGAVYVVNGIGGGPLFGIGVPIPGSVVRRGRSYGAVRVIATGRSLRLECVSVLGEVMDAAHYRRGMPLSSPALHMPPGPSVGVMAAACTGTAAILVAAVTATVCAIRGGAGRGTV